jgi:hypothetical protein
MHRNNPTNTVVYTAAGVHLGAQCSRITNEFLDALAALPPNQFSAVARVRSAAVTSGSPSRQENEMLGLTKTIPQRLAARGEKHFSRADVHDGDSAIAWRLER